MIRPPGPGGRCRRRALSSAPAVTRRSKGPPALTTPLRAGSPVPRSTGEDSPVRADSSGTAAPHHGAVGGNHLTGADQHHIAGIQGLDRDGLERIAVITADRARRPLQQALQSR